MYLHPSLRSNPPGLHIKRSTDFTSFPRKNGSYSGRWQLQPVFSSQLESIYPQSATCLSISGACTIVDAIWRTRLSRIEVYVSRSCSRRLKDWERKVWHPQPNSQARSTPVSGCSDYSLPRTPRILHCTIYIIWVGSRLLAAFNL